MGKTGRISTYEDGGRWIQRKKGGGKITVGVSGNVISNQTINYLSKQT